MVEEVEGDAGPESFGRDVHRLVAYLYAKNCLLYFMRLERILQVFHVMMYFLSSGDIHQHGEIVSMEFQTYRVLVVHSPVICSA